MHFKLKIFQPFLYLGHFVFVNLIFRVVSHFDLWNFFGFQPMEPSYADLRAYTAQVTCNQNGIDYRINNCDPWNRDIGMLDVYVPILKFFNLNESRTEILGFSFQILLFFAIYTLAYALRLDLKRPSNAIFLLIVLISPPVAITIERGQFEVILLVFILLSGYLLLVNKQSFVFAILGFLSFLKMYPIVLFMLLLLNRSFKKTKSQIFLGVIVLILSILVILPEFMGQGGETPANALSVGFWRTFGVTVLPYLSIKFLKDLQVLSPNFEFSLFEAHLSGMLLTFFLVATLFYLKAKKKSFGPDLTPLLKDKSLASNTVLLSLGMVVITYFIISSFDYRMIYLIPLCVLGLVNDDVHRDKKLKRYLVYGILIAMWSQAYIWTSALVQIPILVSLILILFNLGPTLQSQYASPFHFRKVKSK